MSTRMIQKTFNRFATLNTQFLLNKSRNAVRFESQNLLWDYEESNYQSQVFAKGLASLSFKQNDNILLRLSSSQQLEAYIAKLGTAALGVNLILSQAKSESEVERNSEITTLKLSSLSPLYRWEVSSTSMCQKNCFLSLRLHSTKYTSLISLIQTNFYSFPGIYKFKSILNYTENKYLKIKLSSLHSTISAQHIQHSLRHVACQRIRLQGWCTQLSINGRYLVIVEPKDVNRIAALHQYRVDLVATEEIANLHSSINMLVEKGSSILKRHAHRSEV